MLDLRRRRPDVRAFVAALEAWIIASLVVLQCEGRAARRPRRGLGGAAGQAAGPHGEIAEDKIAAIGIRLRRWVSFHGIALNVEPDLTHFSGITPCGVSGRRIMA